MFLESARFLMFNISGDFMIYADHAATTAISPTALEAMRPYLETEYGNPSTLYSLARKPRKAVSEAREIIANAIGAKPKEIFFTACGTEADNWALSGTACHYKGGRIITSAIEHHAVLNTCAFLERMGFAVSYLKTDANGLILTTDMEEAITSDTRLVSIMLANNEIGTIEPIR